MSIDCSSMSREELELAVQAGMRAVKAFEAMLIGCTEQSFSEYQNGDGRNVGQEIERARKQFRARTAKVRPQQQLQRKTAIAVQDQQTQEQNENADVHTRDLFLEGIANRP